MSLPAPWTDKIFTKLTLAYGRDFIGRWEGLEINDVKSDWSHELSGFDAHPEAIAYALANLPHKPPSVIEFRAIARRAPQAAVPRLEAPRAAPERVAEELAKLAPLRAKKSDVVAGGKDWAHSIIARDKAGERLRPITLRFAREALGIKPEKAPA